MQSLKFSEVRYEPEGPSTFPDFSVNGVVAVEATLLTACPAQAGEESPSSVFPSRLNTVKNVIDGHVWDKFSRSRYVSLHFRSFPEVETIRGLLKDFLKKCVDENLWEVKRYRLSADVDVDILPAGKRQGSPFVFGGATSFHLDGWVGEDLRDQCKYALSKKEKKLKSLPDYYQECWLAVGSELTIGLSEADFTFLSNSLNVQTGFSKLILVDASRPEKSRMIEIPTGAPNTCLNL